MKKLSHSKRIISYFILLLIVTFNSFGQIQFANEHATPKVELNDGEALKKFDYEKFTNQVQTSFLKLGYNYKEDKCLQNYLTVVNNNLFTEIFNLYTADKSKEAYSKLYKLYLPKFESELANFKKVEIDERKEWQRRIDSALPATKN